MNAVYACIGYAAGVLTMVIVFVVGERFWASEHFCPNKPQLSKLANLCDCAHSDRHRKMDWETINSLTADINTKEKDIANLKKEALEYRKMDKQNYVVCGKCHKEYHTLNLFDCPWCDQAQEEEKQGEKNGAEEAGVAGLAADGQDNSQPVP